MSHKKFVFSDEKGQAFDVFKLLIAAVVAVVILTILMQILTTILPIFQQGNPTEQAKSQLKTQVTMLGTPATTAVTFNSGDALSSKTIAEASPAVTKEQVCILPGDYGEDKSFEVIAPGQMIQYKGTSRISNKLLILCDYGQDLGETLSTYGYKWATQFSSCELCDTESTSRCCVVAIIKGD